MADPHTCPFSLCQHLHAFDQYQILFYNLDPWTLETSISSDSDALVYVEDDQTII